MISGVFCTQLRCWDILLLPRLSVSHLTAGSCYLLGGPGRDTCSPGGLCWVMQEHLKGAGEEAELPSADTSVEKAVEPQLLFHSHRGDGFRQT